MASTNPAPPSNSGKWVLTSGTLEAISGTLTIQGNQQWTYVGPTSASIGSISPSSGPTTGGTIVTITGAGFTGANTVLLGTTSLKFTFVNDRTITATTKPASAGVADFRVVTTNDGTTPITPADLFTFTAPVASSAPGWLIPLYQYPTGGEWATIAATTIPAGVTAIVVVNPSDGVGTAIDPNYVSAIATAKANGWTVYGYVLTKDGTVSETSLQSSVDTWFNWYGVLNIFFDDCTCVASELAYTTAMTQYVRTTHGAGKAMWNSVGQTLPIEDTAFLSTSVLDTLVVCEGSYAQFASNPPPTSNAGGADIAYIVYSCSQAQFETVLATATPGVAYIYCTDQVGTLSGSENPYAALPSYFATENAALTSAPSQLESELLGRRFMGAL